MRKYILEIILVLMMITNVQAQSNLFIRTEDSLKILMNEIAKANDDSVFDAKTMAFQNVLKNSLKRKTAFDYSFDTIKIISKLKPDDNSFRIFTWSFVKKNNEQKFFGIVLIKEGNVIHVLKEMENTEDDVSNMVCDKNNWSGAVYYKIITKETGNKKYYTLLGWQGNRNMIARKIIDVLVFDENREPKFGADIFKTKEAEPKRIIFKYSPEAIMVLKYDKQHYKKVKGQSIYAYDKKINLNRKKPKKVKMIKEEMIVFDRLVPLNKELKGVEQFYYPSSEFYDALIFRDGKWRMIEDVETRNEER